MLQLATTASIEMGACISSSGLQPPSTESVAPSAVFIRCISERAGKIRLTMDGITVPANLRRRLDVTDFATPVTRIDTFVEDGNAVVEISPAGNYDYIAYQSGSQFTVSVEKLTEQEAESRREEKFPYTGEKLSLNFQDIEVRSVLQLIADFKA